MPEEHKPGKDNAEQECVGKGSQKSVSVCQNRANWDDVRIWKKLQVKPEDNEGHERIFFVVFDPNPQNEKIEGNCKECPETIRIRRKPDGIGRRKVDGCDAEFHVVNKDEKCNQKICPEGSAPIRLDTSGLFHNRHENEHGNPSNNDRGDDKGEEFFDLFWPITYLEK